MEKEMNVVGGVRDWINEETPEEHGVPHLFVNYPSVSPPHPPLYPYPSQQPPELYSSGAAYPHSKLPHDQRVAPEPGMIHLPGTSYYPYDERSWSSGPAEAVASMSHQGSHWSSHSQPSSSHQPMQSGNVYASTASNSTDWEPSAPMMVDYTPSNYPVDGEESLIEDPAEARANMSYPPNPQNQPYPPQIAPPSSIPYPPLVEFEDDTYRASHQKSGVSVSPYETKRPVDTENSLSLAEVQTNISPQPKQRESGDSPDFPSLSSNQSKRSSPVETQVSASLKPNLQNSLHTPDVESLSSNQSRPSKNVDDREFLRSVTGAKLFHLMDIRSDRQDLSYVEKIILPRGQIVSFCEALEADSTRVSRDGELSLSFEQLDKRSLNVVGFYGSKDVLIESLRCYGAIVSDESDQVYAKMRGDSLFPGLYGLLHDNCLIVLYWHHGPVLPSASRKDISCNFVRYLVDLCDSVFILLEGSGVVIRDALSRGNLAKSVRQTRTRKMRIEKLTASENKVEVLRGFSLQLNISGSAPWEHKSFAALSANCFICEGSRCGVLSYTTTLPRKSWRQQHRSMRLQDLSQGVKIFDGRSVDFGARELEDEDLSLFLQCSGCPVGQQYIRQLEAFEKRRDDLKSAQKNERDREQRLKKYEEEVEKALADFISECVKTSPKLAWEEALRANAPLEDLRNLLIASDEGLQREAPTNNPPGLFGKIGQMIESVIPRSRDSRHDVRPKHGHVGLKAMESHINTGLGRLDKAQHRFIFQTNRVIVRSRNSNGQIYRVEQAVGTSKTNPYRGGPLRHNDRISLKAVKSKQSKEVIFRTRVDLSYDGPILTNTPLLGYIYGLSSEYFLEVVEDEFALGGLQDWVASEVDRLLPQLSKKACLFSYVVYTGNTDDKSWHETRVQHLLQLPDGEFLHDVLSNQSTEAVDRISDMWEDICTGAAKQVVLLEEVIRQCSEVYERGRTELWRTFDTWSKRYMKRLLETWIQHEDDESRRDMEERLKEEKARMLHDLRRNQAHRDQSVVRLRCCYIVGSDNLGGHRQVDVNNVRKLLGRAKAENRENFKLILRYDEEVNEMETEKWLVQELSSSKLDLERLEVDPNHTFLPTSQAPRHVLSLDPSTQKLLKLAFLKAGQYLAFIRTTKAQLDQCYVSLITVAGKESIVHTMNHGFDLIAFDEQTRFLALYDGSNVMIKTYRFEEGYKHLEFSGAEVYLKELGVSSVTWMKFIPGRAEVVFVDSDDKVRVFEMAAPGMVRAKEIQLPGPFARAEVTRQGPCLLVFNEPITGSQSAMKSGVTLQMEVYWIDQSMSHVSTIPVHNFEGPKVHFEVAVHSFGPQEHLLLYTRENPNRILSQVLKITSASEEYQLFSDAASKLGGSQHLSSGLALDYLYHVYEKFSTNPPLAKQSRALSLYIVLNEEELKEECLRYVDSCFKKLQTEKGKNFHGLDRQCLVRESSEVSLVLTGIAQNTRGYGKRGFRTRNMGDWIRQLVCLVPIQIARAENNCLTPLADGLELSADVDYDNTISLSSLLRFGFYDAVFASWRNKPLKIISSMGKQSSGKSYLLNHLSGSLLDVSGGRCTDGVWMTVRISDDDEKGCMYVLLDFEGVGTFERSEQEDMLLSVLNAAISNITIYNKKDFNLDRETETVFERFQNGVSLVKEDEKLFSGLFYMAVKDVGEDDVDDLDEELTRKIQKMLANSRENFLTKMYGGRVNLGLMASFDTPHYYTSIDQIYDTVNDPELKTSYTDGKSFSTDLRLLIAQICAKDWASMDSKRMELRVYLIHAHLNSAISMGRLDTKGNEVNLVNFDTQEDIQDDRVLVGENMFAVNDTGLKLKPCDDGDSIGDILTNLKELFQDIVQRTGENDEGWHAGFADFLDRLADRRRHRVLEWITCNAQTFQQHDEIERIKLQATASCSELKQKLSVCSCSCKKCFLRCTKEKGHAHEHSCLGDHMCSQSCSYCVRENVNETNPISKCMDAAGHEGSHDCKSKSHTCTENCVYDGIAANCNSKCAGSVDHSGKHLCNSREHKCSETCSLHSCNNPCVTPFELQDHTVHACHEKFCPMPCSMKGCNRICESKDHFHDNDSSAKHFCGLSHPCPEKCEARGNCAVQQDLIKTTKTFVSKYGSFEYDHVAEQSGIRKPCCKEIPPFQTTHEGPHAHTLNEKVVHICDTKCRACGYFCTLPIGHDGLHNTVHGNMRDTKFAAESEKIKIEDRVYAWGESGAAEMCNMHCKHRGRGHIHLVLCPTATLTESLFARMTRVCYRRRYPDGVKHETQKYGPDFDVPKDEMTHAAYWRHMRFVDPCTQEDQALFNLCGHECQSEEHNRNERSDKFSEKEKSLKSFCTLQVWHNPVTEEERKKFTEGYITRDGHHMKCKHEKPSNVVFVIDRSGSMSDDDSTPQFVQFQETHNNRLGCVFEAILRFVRTRSGLLLSQEADLASVVLFNSSNPAVTVVELEVMEESIVNKLLTHRPSGGTMFSTGLKQAERILLKAKNDGDQRLPVLIFLSDGSNFSSDNDETMSLIRSMRSQLDQRLLIFTVKFGDDKEELLDKMADNGKSYVSVDRLMLSDTFITMAKSLKPQTAALLAADL